MTPAPELEYLNTDERIARRKLIKQVAAALGFAAVCGPFALAKQANIDSNAIRKFSATLKGRIIVPGDTDYERMRRTQFWNSEMETWPALIVRCAHPDDILRTVEFSRFHELETAVRAGGHSFQGWGVSNGVVIDLSEMKRISIDAVGRTGRVDAGVLSGEFVTAAGKNGLAPVLGQCATVGVAGLTLGGGLGWLSGEYGAACDNLLSAKVVTADGRLLEADATRNADLFWAIRGGSGNFGIATSLEFRLHPIDQVSTGEIVFTLRNARAVLNSFSELMKEAPDNFQPDLVFVPGAQIVSVTYVHSGSVAEAEKMLDCIRAWGTPLKETSKLGSFSQHAGMPPGKRQDPSPGDFSCTKGASLESLSNEAIDAMLECLERAPPEGIMGISHYMHGAVCRVKPDATAFELRRAGSVSAWMGAGWKDPAIANSCLSWVSQSSQLLRSVSGNRIYCNYQSYEGKGSAEAVFGGNLARLVGIKRKFDPTNFFHRNSNIKPA